MNDAAEILRSFRVGHELGLHARPAGRFVTVASKFDAEISVARGEEWVSGTSVLSLLSLAAASAPSCASVPWGPMRSGP